VRARLNLEAAAEPAIVAIAVEVRPDQVTFVPERREELTTEGGLDVVRHRSRVADVVARCRTAGVEVSLFIDPEPAQVEASKAAGAVAVELHTGRYANASPGAARSSELAALVRAGAAAVEAGLALHAGHGLDYQNVFAVARISAMAELNIGHSIVSRSVFVGLERAVREMKECMIGAAIMRNA
jgi:pyridoxine 5-phosphate synthase